MALRDSWLERGARLQAALKEFHRAGDVLPDHVAFDVHPVALAQRRQAGVPPRERDDHHLELRIAKGRNRQADAIDRDRAFGPHRRRERRRYVNRQPVRVTILPDPLESGRAVDVTLDEVTAEAAVGAHRPFEVYRLSHAERPD